jgi:hypothetical protein
VLRDASEVMSGTRRKPDRMGPYVSGFRNRFAELGYSPAQFASMLQVLAAWVGRWSSGMSSRVARVAGALEQLM